MRTTIVLCAMLALVPLAAAEEASEAPTPAFHEPVLLEADGKPIAMESPGFAAPTMADVDGDGLMDLVAGQFRQGKMHFFKNVGTAKAPKFAKGDWIKSGDKPAIVPGVW